MSRDIRDAGLPPVVWVSNKSLASALDAATWLETTRELSELGWPITLVAEGPSGHHTLHGVPVYCLAKPRAYGFGNLVFHLRVLRYLWKEQAECGAIIFHQDSAPWLLPVRVAALLDGRKRPLLVMDTRDVVAVGTGMRNRIRRLYFRVSHWLANSWADGQTAITPRMAQLVGIPVAHLWGTWPSGVDAQRFQPAATGRHWPDEGEPVRLIYIGTFVRDRNLHLLCRAVERANSEGMNFELSLVGDGPERFTLEEAARRAKGSVRVERPVPHDQIPDLLRRGHVGVTSLPSSYDAKFEASSPIKLFEYMAAGMPVIAADNACHTDVVGTGSYAFWVRRATEDGILAALRQVELARNSFDARGSEAAGAAQSWTWQEAGRKLGRSLEHGILGLAGGSSV